MRLRDAGLDARFELFEKLHITLAFLGNVEPEAVAQIEAALDAAASATPAFSLVLDRLSAFPSERRPRVVFVGSREQGPAFRKAASNVREALAEIGFTFDKAAVAHVTLARVKGGRAHLPLLDVAPIPLTVRRLTLYQSIPDGRTTRYEIVKRADLV